MTWLNVNNEEDSSNPCFPLLIIHQHHPYHSSLFFHLLLLQFSLTFTLLMTQPLFYFQRSDLTEEFSLCLFTAVLFPLNAPDSVWLQQKSVVTMAYSGWHQSLHWAPLVWGKVCGFKLPKNATCRWPWAPPEGSVGTRKEGSVFIWLKPKEPTNNAGRLCPARS